MSALPPKADMCGAQAHVCFGPIADIRQCKRHVRFLAFGWGTHVFNQRGALSQTHASCANHSCSVRQKGQCERLKNTGVARKRARSASYPVEISRPVFGQRIITVPIVALFGECTRSEVAAACEGGLTSARQSRDLPTGNACTIGNAPE